MKLLWATVALAAAALLPYLPMPSAYSGRRVLDIPPSRLAALARWPADYSGFATVDAGRLLRATRLFEGRVLGSETTSFAKDGALTMLDRYGLMHVAQPEGDGTLALRGPGRPIGAAGRPLGFVHDSTGRLVLCDSVAGLLRWDPSTGITELLTNSLPDGTPLRYLDDVVEASDGTLYFSSASDQPPPFGDGYYDTLAGSKLNVARGDASGRLLKWDPRTRATSVVLDELWFANGVALSPAEDFVLVVETFLARITRAWLSGPRAGTSDIFVADLPGFPDGVSPRAAGGFWVRPRASARIPRLCRASPRPAPSHASHASQPRPSSTPVEPRQPAVSLPYLTLPYR